MKYPQFIIYLIISTIQISSAYCYAASMIHNLGDSFVNGMFRFTITDSIKHEVSILLNNDYHANIDTLTIPQVVTNNDVVYNVRHIADYGFMNSVGIHNVQIPEGIYSIGHMSFRGCKGLRSVLIPSTVINIGEWAFADCSSIENIMVETGNKIYSSPLDCNAIIDKKEHLLVLGCQNTIIPEGIETIGAMAFYGCERLKQIKLPSSLKRIHGFAFAGCKALKNIELPDGLTSLNHCAFAGTALRTVTLPASLNYYDNPFGECSNLHHIWVSKNNKNYHSIKHGRLLLETPSNKIVGGCIKRLKLPRENIEIAIDAFQDNYILQSLYVPESTDHIPSTAFDGCIYLSQIKVNKKNKVYDSRSNCNAVIMTSTNTIVQASSNTRILSSIIEIAPHAFCGIATDSVMTIPNHISKIGGRAFAECSNLKEIILPSSLKDCGTFMFADCQNLRKATIALSNIPYSCFSCCINLSEIQFDELTVKKIDGYAFENCKKLKNIIIPSCVESIKQDAFIGCPCEEEISKQQAIHTPL